MKKNNKLTKTLITLGLILVIFISVSIPFTANSLTPIESNTILSHSHYRHSNYYMNENDEKSANIEDNKIPLADSKNKYEESSFNITFLIFPILLIAVAIILFITSKNKKQNN